MHDLQIHAICSTVVAHSEEMTHGFPWRAPSRIDAQVSTCLLLVVAVLVVILFHFQCPGEATQALCQGPSDGIMAILNSYDVDYASTYALTSMLWY